MPTGGAILIVLPDSVTNTPLIPSIVTGVEPDVFDTIVLLFAPPAPTLNAPSFVALASFTVKLGYVPVLPTIVTV